MIRVSDPPAPPPGDLLRCVPPSQKPPRHTARLQPAPARAVARGFLALASLALALQSAPGLRAQAPGPVTGFISEGYFWVGFPTVPGQSYWVECSTNLLSWETLSANLPGSGGELQVLDPASGPGEAGRFYRVGARSGAGPEEPPGNPDPARWVWLPPGTFSLGSPADAPGREADEGPVTATQLTHGFWVGRQEVTQRQYQSLTGVNPSWFSADPDRPVENVSYGDATNYCALLTVSEQLAGRLPAGYTYRLPTEAEWEYACRAGSTGSFCFGELDAGEERLGYYAWDFDNSGSTNAPPGFALEVSGSYYTTQVVGTRQPNAWGLDDLHGNVWEWCLDWYASQYDYPGGSATDPGGPASGAARVIRGGSWNAGPNSCRSANRSAALPEARSSGIGFRVILDPVP